jgi:calreticulin
MKFAIALVLASFIAATFATVYYEDDFSKDGWDSRWVVSDWKKADGTAGTWDLSAGTYFSDEKAERGLHTTQDARFYAISSKIAKPFSNKDKTLVIQFSVKHQQNIDCGGGYIKLLPEGLDQPNFNGDAAYNIMFGPDICGAGHRIVHFILNKRGENRLIKRNVNAENDEHTHSYTAVLKADNTYEIYVDGERKQDGKIEDDWSILPAKEINDPSQSKPSDWVDDAMMDDPEDKKPDDWDTIPAEISDPDAKKPDDWDDDLDGAWEAPKVPNPAYKGVWRAKRISNPAYKGPWVHPQIPNPDYKPDSTLYQFDSNAFLGIEIWQVKAGSIFDNFLVTDDLDLALERAKALNKVREAEQAAKKAVDDAKAAADAEAAKSAEPAENAEAEKDDL